MCGIWGMYGKPRTVQHDKFLKEAAVTGTLRGAHATGVFHVYYNNKLWQETFSVLGKDAVPGHDFVDGKIAKDLLNSRVNSLAIVGHNRYATGGGMDAEHAHPFRVNNITLVHNGVLDNAASLRYDHKFERSSGVDSEVVAQLLAAMPAKEALEKLEGAYALVWHDDKENVIRFARNSERPMHFADCGDVVLFGSELGMLTWLADRNSLKVKDTSELPVGTLLTLQQSEAGVLVADKQEFKAAVRYKSWQGYRSWGDFLGESYPATGASSGAASSSTGTGTQNRTTTSDVHTNCEGLTYGECAAYIQQHLDVVGVSRGVQHDWVLNSFTTLNDRNVLRLVSSEASTVQAIKTVYLGGHTSDPQTRAYREAEKDLVEFLKVCQDDVVGVTAKSSGVVLAEAAAGNGWMAYKASELLSERLFYVMLDTQSLVFHGLGDRGRYVELFNMNAHMTRHGYNVVRKPVVGSVYSVSGVPEDTLRNVYKGSPLVTFRGYPKTNKECAIVTPNSNLGVSLMVPLTALRGV